MENYFSVNYDTQSLSLNYNGESFEWSLVATSGDLGDFWHSFALADGTLFDINFYQDYYYSEPSLAVYSLEKSQDGLAIVDMNLEERIPLKSAQGDASYFFDNYYKIDSSEKISKKELAIKQIKLLERVQHVTNVNMIECNKCSTIILYDRCDEKITCFCGHTQWVEDCTDYWYDGMENNSEFN